MLLGGGRFPPTRRLRDPKIQIRPDLSFVPIGRRGTPGLPVVKPTPPVTPARGSSSVDLSTEELDSPSVFYPRTLKILNRSASSADRDSSLQTKVAPAGSPNRRPPGSLWAAE